jgi:uncharacterized membrane protein YuzA (DUF378 family)
MKNIIRVGFFLFVLATALQLVIKSYNQNIVFIVIGIIALLSVSAFILYNNKKIDNKEKKIRKAYNEELLAKKLASNDSQVSDIDSKDKKEGK